jgi:glucose-6-phosphate isomerase
MNAIDKHFQQKDFAFNIPVMLGLIGFYNSYIADHSSRAILPYC